MMKWPEEKENYALMFILSPITSRVKLEECLTVLFIVYE